MNYVKKALEVAQCSILSPLVVVFGCLDASKPITQLILGTVYSSPEQQVIGLLGLRWLLVSHLLIRCHTQWDSLLFVKVQKAFNVECIESALAATISILIRAQSRVFAAISPFNPSCWRQILIKQLLVRCRGQRRSYRLALIELPLINDVFCQVKDATTLLVLLLLQLLVQGGELLLSAEDFTVGDLRAEPSLLS